MWIVLNGVKEWSFTYNDNECNFFNNWLSMAYFIPISYYLYEIKLKNKKKIA